MISRLRVLAVVLAPLLVLAGCGEAEKKAEDEPSAKTSPSASATPSDTPAGTCQYPSSDMSAARPAEAPPAEPVTKKPVTATINTNVGTIKVRLEADKAPCTVHSFLSLGKQGYFDGTSCHRLTTQGIYVLQCGDPTGSGSGGPGYSFADELLPDDDRIQPCQKMQGMNVCTYGPGTLAMANAGADTNGSQFFLVYENSPLPANYTVFGRMDAAGLKTVKKVAAAGVGTPVNSPTDGGPRTKVVIEAVKSASPGGS